MPQCAVAAIFDLTAPIPGPSLQNLKVDQILYSGTLHFVVLIDLSRNKRRSEASDALLSNPRHNEDLWDGHIERWSISSSGWTPLPQLLENDLYFNSSQTARVMINSKDSALCCAALNLEQIGRVSDDARCRPSTPSKFLCGVLQTPYMPASTVFGDGGSVAGGGPLPWTDAERMLKSRLEFQVAVPFIADRPAYTAKSKLRGRRFSLQRRLRWYQPCVLEAATAIAKSHRLCARNPSLHQTDAAAARNGHHRHGERPQSQAPTSPSFFTPRPIPAPPSVVPARS